MSRRILAGAALAAGLFAAAAGAQEAGLLPVLLTSDVRPHADPRVPQAPPVEPWGEPAAVESWGEPAAVEPWGEPAAVEPWGELAAVESWGKPAAVESWGKPAAPGAPGLLAPARLLAEGDATDERLRRLFEARRTRWTPYEELEKTAFGDVVVESIVPVAPRDAADVGWDGWRE